MVATALFTAGIAAGGGGLSIRGCSDAADCGFNGECRTGACVCSAPWAGPECQRLLLRDVVPAAGLRELSTSTWGGSVVAGDDGRL